MLGVLRDWPPCRHWNFRRDWTKEKRRLKAELASSGQFRFRDRHLARAKERVKAPLFGRYARRRLGWANGGLAGFAGGVQDDPTLDQCTLTFPPSQSASRQGCLIGGRVRTGGRTRGPSSGPCTLLRAVADVDSAVRSGGDQGRLVVGSAGERG